MLGYTFLFNVAFLCFLKTSENRMFSGGKCNIGKESVNMLHIVLNLLKLNNKNTTRITTEDHGVLLLGDKSMSKVSR